MEKQGLRGQKESPGCGPSKDEQLKTIRFRMIQVSASYNASKIVHGPRTWGHLVLSAYMDSCCRVAYAGSTFVPVTVVVSMVVKVVVFPVVVKVMVALVLLLLLLLLLLLPVAVLDGVTVELLPVVLVARDALTSVVVVVAVRDALTSVVVVVAVMVLGTRRLEVGPVTVVVSVVLLLLTAGLLGVGPATTGGLRVVLHPRLYSWQHHCFFALDHRWAQSKKSASQS